MRLNNLNMINIIDGLNPDEDAQDNFGLRAPDN